MVGETHLGEQRHGGFVKQAAVQWGQSKSVFGTSQASGQVLLLTGVLLKAAAGGDQAEQAAQGGVKVKTVACMGRVEGLQLQLAQRFKAVALEVNLALGNGHVAQLGPRLDVKHEQQAVHHAQAFQAEVGCVQLVFAAEEAFFGISGLFAQLVGGLVAQQLDGFTQGVFQVLTDAKGVFVGVFVQAFQQADAFTGGQAGAVQERGGCLQGGGVFAVKDVDPVKTQGAIVGPFVAVQQQPVVEPQQDDVTRWVFGTEEGFGNDAGPSFAL